MCFPPDVEEVVSRMNWTASGNAIQQNKSHLLDVGKPMGDGYE